MMAKVSIIVPVYNTERYLKKCLDSLVNQTLEDLEIIVVNDGSTDGSQMIINGFQEKYPAQIKSFTKENGGLSDARNFGLDRAKGEFIGFVDSDDYVSQNMFLEMYELAKKNSAELVICNVQKVNEKGAVTQKLTQIPHLPEKLILEENLSVFSDLSYFACNKLFRKELFEGRRFKKGVQFEDIQLIPQLLLQCTTLSQTQNYHYQYLERSQSITKTHTEKGLDILEAVREVSAVYRNSKYSERTEELKNFQILQGVYTYLAYLALVKEESVYRKMSLAQKEFIKENGISISEIFQYERFGRNYLLYLSLRKKIYYLLYFLGQQKLLRMLL